MADYKDLFNLLKEPELRNKVKVAIAIKAQTLLDGVTPSVAEVAWADDALKSLKVKADEIMNYVIAANSDKTIVQITGAGDAAIQTNVDAAVDVIISGGV